MKIMFKTALFCVVLASLVHASDSTVGILPASDQYTLTVHTAGPGSVTRNPPIGPYDADTVVTMTATGVGDWVFSGWRGDLTGVENPTAITIDSDKNVTATFIRVEAINGSFTTAPSAYDPDTIPDTLGKPGNFPYGMIEMELAVPVEDLAIVRVTLPDAASARYVWYKYKPTLGWISFDREEISAGHRDGAEFNADRTQITVYILDNGPYDDDAALGSVRDPSGLGPSPPPAGGSSVGCFIATAAFGS